MNKLAAYFQSQGGDTNKVFSDLNNQSRAVDGSVGSTLPEEVVSDGGNLTCIQEDKIVVDSDPQNLGKDGVTALFTVHNEPFLPSLIKELRKKAKNKEEAETIITYAMLPTTIPNPDDNSKTLSKKFVVVAKGRKALLGEMLDKKHHNKFVCYVAYPVK
jgi:hypothetical protein